MLYFCTVRGFHFDKEKNVTNLNFPHVNPVMMRMPSVSPGELQVDIRRMKELQELRPFWKRNQKIRAIIADMYPEARILELRETGWNVQIEFLATMPYPRVEVAICGKIGDVETGYISTFQFQVQWIIKNNRKYPICVSPERERNHFLKITEMMLAKDISGLKQLASTQEYNILATPEWAIHEAKRAKKDGEHEA